MNPHADEYLARGRGGPPSPDKAAMRSSLDALFDLDEVIELRALHKGRKRTDAGYYDGDHRDALVNEAARLNAAGAAIYVNLNCIDPQLLGRYSNRIQDYAKETVTDKDVIRRRGLLIDFDAVRPANTSATDAQVAAAKECAETCRQALEAEGWPQPLVGASGNGMHLVYPLDLPNDAESAALVKGALAGLAARFDTNTVRIDQSVFNAGRVIKLYGSLALKGDHTPTSPWRLARLVSGSCRNGTIVTADQLRALHPKGNGAKAPSDWGRGEFDLPSFLSRLGISYDQDLHEGSDRYKLEHCPFNNAHGWGEAAILRQPDGRLGFRCQHDSCRDKHWQDVRELVDGPKEGRASWRGKAREEHQEGPSESRVLLARGDTLQVEPIDWLWDGWLARGKLHVLAGAPGAGKSTIDLAFAATVTTGGQWPDGTKCDTGDVIAWSDEDDPKDTLLPRFLAAGGDPKRLHIVIGTADDNGVRRFDPAIDIPALLAEAQKVPACALLIVDPVVTVVLGDSHKNTEVRRALQPLEGLARDTNLAVLGISHHTKGTAGRDPVERITGSLAFGAYPRVTMAAAKFCEGDTERRVFCRTKSNIGPDTGGWEYQLALTDVPGVPEVKPVVVARWGEALEGSARDLLANADASSDPEERGAMDEGMDWLRALLKDGPVEAKLIPSAAKQSGVAWRTIERAKARLGVKSRKRDFAVGWWWSLPEASRAPAPARGDTMGVGGLGRLESLEPSCGAGSTEDRQHQKKSSSSTPLKASPGAGSTEDRQEARQEESVGGLRSKLGVVRVPGVSEGESHVGGLRYERVVITLGAGTKEHRSFESGEAPGGMTLAAWEVKARTAHGPDATVRPVPVNDAIGSEQTPQTHEEGVP